MKDISRRDFVKTTAIGSVGLAAGISGFEANATPNAAVNGSGAFNSADILSLPQGGGGISGLNEAFQPDLFRGTATMNVPIELTKIRGYQPPLSLSYASGNPASDLGMGWSMEIACIYRSSRKRIPLYNDQDTFTFSGEEDLIKVEGYNREGFEVSRYKPERESQFDRIEHWYSRDLNKSFWLVRTRQNELTLYGYSSTNRFDNSANGVTYKWYPEATLDNRGNVTRYFYKSDPKSGSEPGGPIQNMYIKKILYGNKQTVLHQDSLLNTITLIQAQEDFDFFGHLLFDYGEHLQTTGDHLLVDDSSHRESVPWAERADAFSSYRSGFEIRSNRLCQRILLFHQIAADSRPQLVKSYDLQYESSPWNKLSRLQSMTYRAYRAKTDDRWSASEELHFGLKGVKSKHYEILSKPPLTFQYQDFDQEAHDLIEVKFDGPGQVPFDLKDRNTLLADMFSKGLPDFVHSSPGGFIRSRNKGHGQFSKLAFLAKSPSGFRLDEAGISIGDVKGNGSADLLVHRGAKHGFFESDQNGGWTSFSTYAQIPSFDLDDPGLVSTDLTGNGLPDVIKNSGPQSVFYTNLGKKGYTRARKIKSEESLPGLDKPEVKLADMTGDGLKDIVVVRSNQVYYYPNEGNGAFGKARKMKNSPGFGSNFNPELCLLADLDGSGTADLIYVQNGKISYWPNCQGNAWGEIYTIQGTPRIHDARQVQSTDINGTGRNCLIISTGRSGGNKLYSLDFMTTGYPHLLSQMKNHLGKKVLLTYGASTHEYLTDEKAGKTWPTTLPFPVKVLKEIRVEDTITGNRMSSSFRYHLGHFDGIERSFRGFGMVERYDTHLADETESSESTEPLLTKTWFHLGNKISEGIAWQSFDEPLFDSSFAYQNSIQSKTVKKLPDLSYKALIGRVTREEKLGTFGTNSHVPYQISQTQYQVKQLENKPLVYASMTEQVIISLERKTDEPRVSQSIVISEDDYGNVLQSCQINYPRLNPVDNEQAKLSVVISDFGFINKETDQYRYIGMAIESMQSEVVNSSWTWNDALLTVQAALNLTGLPIKYGTRESLVSDSSAYRRLLNKTKTYYKADQHANALDSTIPNGRLGFAEIESHGLVYSTYKVAFNDQLFSLAYPAEIKDQLDEATIKSAGFERLENDTFWWAPSGQAAYNPNQFFLEQQLKDALDQITRLTYDNLTFALTGVTDALGNTMSVALDYNVLQPWKVTDPNGNIKESAFDPMGTVTATVQRGKENEQLGDTLTGFTRLQTQGERDAFFNTTNSSMAANLLKGASQAFVYDWWGNFRDEAKPVSIAEIKRYQHHFNNQSSELNLSFTYLDGLGSVSQVRKQSENQWIVSGWEERDNKGNVIKTYEPFLDSSHVYGAETKIGVATRIFFDALNRPYQTLLPNGAFEKTTYGPWSNSFWDANDTLLIKPDKVSNYSPWIKGVFPGFNWQPNFFDTAVKDSPLKKMAVHVVSHANSPEQQYLNANGTAYLLEKDVVLPQSQKLKTTRMLDSQEREWEVTDPRGIVTIQREFDFSGMVLSAKAVDKGTKHAFYNALGNEVLSWQSGNILQEIKYDSLKRKEEVWVSEAGADWHLKEKLIYGETLGQQAAASNLRGQLYQKYDGAGKTEHSRFDFKGNLLSSKQQLPLVAFDQLIWNDGDTFSTDKSNRLLETESFAFQYSYDALNRQVTSTQPDGSELTNRYNSRDLITSIKVSKFGGTEVETVKSVAYNAKSQITEIEYGNGLKIERKYDENTFRLQKIKATNASGQVRSELDFAYDPVGNVLVKEDKALKTIFFDNQQVSPVNTYRYDATYRLIEAKGRESIALNPCHSNDTVQLEETFLPIGQSNGLRNYTRSYEYDLSGNLLKVAHRAGSNANHTQTFKVEGKNNHLTETNPSCGVRSVLQDERGNISQLPHIPDMSWSYSDLLIGCRLANNNESMAFDNDAAGTRYRKTYINANDKTETIYLGAYEVFRKYRNGNLIHEGITVNSGSGITLFCSSTWQRVSAQNQGVITHRYQLSDQVNSSQMEFDDSANAVLLSLEEYFPFGSISYSSCTNRNKILPKKYRFNQKELDKETMLYYYGARYYAPWLGRFLSVDPQFEKMPGWSGYSTSKANPISLVDPDGNRPWTIHINSFIATKDVGFGMFKGDNRSISFKGTSRVATKVVADPVKGTVKQPETHSDPTVFNAIESPFSKENILNEIQGVSDSSSSMSELVTNPNTVTFEISHTGKDPITPQLTTPALDLKAKLSLTESNNSISIKGMFTGDVFPSTEAFIVGPGGENKLFLGGANEQGGITDLVGDNQEKLFNVDLKIELDASSNFKNVIQGGKHYSPQQWNQKVKNEFSQSKK